MLKTGLMAAFSAVFFGCAAQSATYTLYIGSNEDEPLVFGSINLNDYDNNGVLTASEIETFYLDYDLSDSINYPNLSVSVGALSFKIDGGMQPGDWLDGVFDSQHSITVQYYYEYQLPTCSWQGQRDCAQPGFEDEGPPLVNSGSTNLVGASFVINRTDDGSSDLPAVPLPASAALMVSGLAAFGALRRRAQKTA